MTSFSKKETAWLDWLAGQRDAMIALVAALVNIDSGTYDKAGVDAVGAQLRGFLASDDIGFDVIADGRFGDAIRAGVGDGVGTGNAAEFPRWAIATPCSARARWCAARSASPTARPLAPAART